MCPIAYDIDSAVSLSPGKMRNRLANKIIERDWDYVVDRTVRCPGEASEWIEVNMRGFVLKLLPLHVACSLNPPVDVIHALLKADSEAVSLQDANGRLPIHFACDVERASPEVIEALLKAYPDGAQVKEMQFGFLPLHAACCRRNEVNKENCRHDTQNKVIGALLSVYPDAVNEKDDQGWLPLALACRTGASFSVVQRILNENPSATKVMDREMRLPIHLALCARPGENEAVAIARILIEAFPSSLMQQERIFGFLPLHVACSFCNLSSSSALVRTLLVAYPEASKVPDRRGSLPLHLACRAGAPASVIQQLVSIYPQGARHQDFQSRLPLHWACQMKLSNECICILLDAYSNGAQKAEKKYNFLPLHVACLRGAPQNVIETLLRAFPDGAKCRDKKGCLPLHVACKRTEGISKEIVQSLLRVYPSASNEKDYKGATPISLTIENKSNKDAEIIKILSENVVWPSTFPESNVCSGIKQQARTRKMIQDLVMLNVSR